MGTEARKEGKVVDLVVNKENRCPKCLGCGKVADSDEQEPWTDWEKLFCGSDMALAMSVVKSMACPRCNGTGIKPSKVKLLINRKSPVEYGTRPDGSMWLSIETNSGYRESEWEFGEKAAEIFKEAIEKYIEDKT